MSEARNWTPNQIAELTMPQIYYLLTEESELSGGRRMTGTEQEAFIEETRQRYGTAG